MSVSLQLSAKLRNATDAWERGFNPTTFSATGQHLQHERLTVETVEETLSVATDIAGGNGPHWAILFNADATNYIEVGISTGAYFAKLKAGEFALLPLAAGVTTLYLKASTAAAVLEVLIHEG